ncbi:type IV pilus assembly protein PilB [Peptoclostridium litorale DSM 5388]|uniref:Type II secretion system protein E n=1 Tax=Peptoclostridium litorale DSM 5388 TaxID=1121324 RepID=A0A069RAA5_PEPLI|nr:GspE/PulE family protein [Peptoclostridium litorale]KDR93981.1 type II secretion system protein E [Peptoclostridium litorale DSM 5388]SIN79041.1 type IV pilus assembly protein PilB [Peptoclostridium litorale DSM 5388]
MDGTKYAREHACLEKFSENIFEYGEGYAVNVLNELIEQGIEKRASDIHINPKSDHVELRFRIDGSLRLISNIAADKITSIISRLKVISDMDIAENRLPQDGRCMFEYKGKRFDLRAATVPTIFGEKAVIRILDKSNLGYSIETLGMSIAELERIKKSIGGSSGMILVSGPTGSGKTTTIYSILKHMNPENKNILTIEDPVEYIVENASQIQVNKSKGLDFATGLRSIIRSDPDIIMVGEIRDAETAQIAARAAMTGHLVLSSIHTNDSASAVTRLVEMGIHPFMVASSLRCVVAQRLVKKACQNCKQEYRLPNEELTFFGIEDHCDCAFTRGQGCEKCFGTGYLGRVGVYEVMAIDSNIRDSINRGESDAQIKRIAVENGMKTILENSVRLVRNGITTFDEIAVFLNDKV